ncbi:unnamed protein product, partial [Scytosiphon promiscuus]
MSSPQEHEEGEETASFPGTGQRDNGDGHGSTNPSAGVEDGRKLLDQFRRQRRASSVDRGSQAARGRGGGSPRIIARQGARVVSGVSPFLGSHGSHHPARQGEAHPATGMIPGTPVRGTHGIDGSGFRSRSENLNATAGPPPSGSSRGDVSPARSWVGPAPLPAGPDSRGPRARSVPAMRGPGGRDGEDKEAYEAQLAEALGIFEAKRAETADLQGLAAAQAGLESQVSTAPSTPLVRFDVNTTRDLAPTSPRTGLQMDTQKQEGDACSEENERLRSKLKDLEAVEARAKELTSETTSLRATLRETEDRLEQSVERLRQSEELRSKEAGEAKDELDAARKALEDAEADAAERSRERSARAAGLQGVLREQGALLAEREERLAEERSGRTAERMELRELRSRDAGYVRELKQRADEVDELNQLIAQLQDGEIQTADVARVTQSLRAENEALQTRLTQALGQASAAETSARTGEERDRKAHTETLEELRDTQERLRDVEAERSHLEQRLSAVEARVSEAARNRADLSRRLAETVMEAEQAEVENQKLEDRVRSLSETWEGDGGMDLSSTSSSEGREARTQEPPAGGIPPRAPQRPASEPEAAQLVKDLEKQVAVLQKRLEEAESRAAAAAEQNAAAAAESGPTPAGVDVGRVSADGSRGGGVRGGEEDSLAAAEVSLAASRAEQAELKETVASLRGQLDSAQREAFAEKQRMFADVVDAQGELAFEADRREAFEREVTALRARLHQQHQHESQSIDQESSLTQLQAACAERAGDVATAVRRASKAEEELSRAQASVEELTTSSRNLQGRLDAAEQTLQEHARETAAAQARAESAERATAAEAERLRTQLQRRLQDAEERAASLGEKLEAALRAKMEREVQAAQASEAAAAEAVVQERAAEDAASEAARRDLELRLDAAHEELAAVRAQSARAMERSAESAAEIARRNAEIKRLAASVSELEARARDAEGNAKAAEAHAEAARAEAGNTAAKLSAARAKGEATEADLAAVRAWAVAGSKRAGAS